MPNKQQSMPAAGRTAKAARRRGYHEQWIDRTLKSRNYNASSLLLTVLGDSVAPLGRAFWLGDFIRLMASLGVNERLVRTAVFRLGKDSWLDSTRAGRQSFYELTQEAYDGFDDAFDRVYSLDDRSGINDWCMIVTSDLSQGGRKRALREFAKAGFARLSPGTYIHPTIDFHSADLQLKKLGIRDHCLLMRAGLHPLNSPQIMKQHLTQWWNLEAIEKDYAAFRNAFEPLFQNLRRLKSISGERAFVMRTILVHDYRQLTIASPQLPTDLLGRSWGGVNARNLVGNLYRLLSDPAAAHVDKVLAKTGGVDSEDRKKAERLKYLSRFGGLI